MTAHKQALLIANLCGLSFVLNDEYELCARFIKLKSSSC